MQDLTSSSEEQIYMFGIVTLWVPSSSTEWGGSAVEQLEFLSSRTIRCTGDRVTVETTQTLAQGQYHADRKRNGNHSGKNFSHFFVRTCVLRYLREEGDKKAGDSSRHTGGELNCLWNFYKNCVSLSWQAWGKKRITINSLSCITKK